jgi:hypothetical protein
MTLLDVSHVTMTRGPNQVMKKFGCRGQVKVKSRYKKTMSGKHWFFSKFFLGSDFRYCKSFLLFTSRFFQIKRNGKYRAKINGGATNCEKMAYRNLGTAIWGPQFGDRNLGTAIWDRNLGPQFGDRIN